MRLNSLSGMPIGHVCKFEVEPVFDAIDLKTRKLRFRIPPVKGSKVMSLCLGTARERIWAICCE